MGSASPSGCAHITRTRPLGVGCSRGPAGPTPDPPTREMAPGAHVCTLIPKALTPIVGASFTQCQRRLWARGLGGTERDCSSSPGEWARCRGDGMEGAEGCVGSHLEAEVFSLPADGENLVGAAGDSLDVESNQRCSELHRQLYGCLWDII